MPGTNLPVPDWQRGVCGMLGLVGWIVLAVWMVAALQAETWPSASTGLVMAFLFPFGNFVFTYVAFKGDYPRVFRPNQK